MKVQTAENRIEWFDDPVQVRFWDGMKKRYYNGIGYRDEVIHGYNGDRSNIQDIYMWADNCPDDEPIKINRYWNNLEDALN